MPRFSLARFGPPLPRPWKDHVGRPFAYFNDIERERKYSYQRIDEGKFGWWTVFVAGAGFLTDAYDIFAVNMVLPMITIVYWNGNIPEAAELSIGLSTLIGALIGQVSVGILADRYGRKKLYGIELIILMFATVGLALCSRGAANSVNILAWIISWRLLMGIGIGGDYPLSAVICSEFAPRKHRAKMLAALFMMQPIGQLMGNITAIIATASLRHRIMENADPFNCTGECLQATDEIWRWVVGIGAIPPAVAVVFRMYIPESIRYTLEVEKDLKTARQDRDAYFPAPTPVSIGRNQLAAGVQVPTHDTSGTFATYGFTEEPRSITGPPAPQEWSEPEQGRREPFQQSQTPDVPPHTSLDIQPAPLEGSSRDSTQAPSRNSPEPSEGNILSGNLSDLPSLPGLPGLSGLPGLPMLSLPNAIMNEEPGKTFDPSRHVRKASWKQYWSDFRIFLFGEKPWKERNWRDGSWTDLAGTSLTWLLLDMSFYFLGVNSSKILSKLWDTPTYTEVYPMLMQFGWRSLISNSVGALFGSVVFIALARFRYNLQIYGFLVLAALFVAISVCYVTLLGGKYFAAIISLYALCPLFFNLGPNTSTYLIPAEVFPTHLRCTCHGISAAFGKLGSIIAQIFLAKLRIKGRGVDGPRSTWLGWALLINMTFMALGAIITKIWVPNPCDSNGESRSLEDLETGKEGRRKLELREKNQWRGEGVNDVV